MTRWALALLLLLCVARMWLMPLPSSFWLDETATVFVVRHGAADPSLAAAPQVPDSAYYWLPRLSSWLLGNSEVAYRIPSILAMALAVWTVARLAERLIHPRAAWFAAFACLALHDLNEYAADARPYALNLCVGSVAVWALVRWLDTAKWKWAVLFWASGALLWRVHLTDWPFYFVFASYAAVRLWRGKTAVTWKAAAGAFAAMGAALIPVALHALALMRNAQAHVIQPLPTLHHVEWTLRWNLVAISLAAAWLLSRAYGWRRENGRVALDTAVLILGWWLVQPLGLLAFSYVTGDSVYVDRYFALALPGLALCATWAVSPFLGERQWWPVAAAVGCGALLLLGQWNTVWPPHRHSDWRGAAAAVNRFAPDSAAPVICPSAFIEARPPEWRPDYHLPGFLYSQLEVYPVRGKTILFPFAANPQAEAYAVSLAGGTLPPARRFAIYGGAGPVRYWRKWFAARGELQGWRYSEQQFGDVWVTFFTKPGKV